MPLSTGGLNAGLKWTITPGLGRANSFAWAIGKGPTVLAKKANRIKKHK
ncbi:MAG: hypothetical protein HY591_04655 [Candidatus Omnitrophica bacterium]|nr:hypothetical protein [Candidatus Omnitrophota bacterium]